MWENKYEEAEKQNHELRRQLTDLQQIQQQQVGAVVQQQEGDQHHHQQDPQEQQQQTQVSGQPVTP
jgi:hypothetical protein